MNPMPRPRELTACLLAVGLLLLASACGVGPDRRTASTTPSPAAAGSGQGRAGEQPGTAPVRWRVVALGDSVTSGGPCDCTPFPQVYAATLSDVRGVSVGVDNLGQGGQDSGGLLDQLRDPRSPQTQAVRTGDIDLVTIGANDFSAKHGLVTAGRCSGDLGTDCVQDELGRLRTNLAAIVAAIHRLRAGRATAVLVTGYWNVFEDGAVARSSFPDRGVAATVALTRQANARIRGAATATGATYVDLYAPFHGPAADGETTKLLGDDGDHPNARGQVLIARRLVAAGLPGLVKG